MVHLFLNQWKTATIAPLGPSAPIVFITNLQGTLIGHESATVLWAMRVQGFKKLYNLFSRWQVKSEVNFCFDFKKPWALIYYEIG